MIAFGAKNSIYVQDRVTGRFTQLLSGHTDRVCAIEFSRSRPTLLYSAGTVRLAWSQKLARSHVPSAVYLCVTLRAPVCGACVLMMSCVGADRSVRVWDVQRGVQIGSHATSRVEVTALASSELLADGVISGDKSGKLVQWRHAAQDITQHTPIAESITCLAMSAVSAAHVAVGYKVRATRAAVSTRTLL